MSIVTPTRNRPLAFSLLERWVRAQTVMPEHEWLVGTDGDEGYEYTMGQRVIRRSPRIGQSHSLCGNLSAALCEARGRHIIVLEDDDYYAPTYILDLLRLLDDPATELAGIRPAFYYHLPSRRWQCMGNRSHSSLAQTGFRNVFINEVLNVCSRGKPFIDVAIWGLDGVTKKQADTRRYGRLLHVGMKGLPGEPGIGVGHRAQLKNPDPELKWLRAQMGEDAEAYEGIDCASGSTETQHPA